MTERFTVAAAQKERKGKKPKVGQSSELESVQVV